MLRALGSAPAVEAGQVGRLDAALARVGDPGRSVPRLRDDVEVARFTTRWGDRYAIAHSPAPGAYLRLSGDEAEVLAGCDGTRSVAELVVERISAGAALDAEEVVALVVLLRARGFLDEAPRDVYAAVTHHLTPRRRLMGARLWRFVRRQTIPFPGADAFTGRVYALGGRLAFTPSAVAAGAVTIAVGLGAFVVVARRGTYAIVGHISTLTALSLFGLGLVALFMHEMSHALAVRHAGRRVVSAGFQLYLAHPAFFIDSTDLTLAPPRARAINAAAGPYAEAVVAGMAGVVTLVAPIGELGAVLFRFAGLTYLNVLLNLIPFLELDGYWLVSDLLDVPRLRPRSLAVLRFELPDRLRGRRGPFTRTERALAGFGVAAVVFTVAALATAVTFWGPVATRLVTALWRAGAVGRVLVVLLSGLVIGPAVTAAGHLLAALVRRARTALDDLRFYLQSSWRAEAAEAVAALPLLAGRVAPDSVELAELAGRVRRRRAHAGEAVVRKGGAADAFYLVRAGHLLVTADHGSGAEVVRHLGPGESFGEVALLEGTPRTATVRADTESELFEVDAGTFGRLLAASALSAEDMGYRRSLLEVSSLPPFSHLSDREVVVVAERGTWDTFAPHHTVLREGEVAERFYVIAAGQVEVIEGEERRRVLHAGEHFGEIALLRGIPRTATVRTLTPTRLFSLDAAAFEALVAGAFDRADLTLITAEHVASGAH